MDATVVHSPHHGVPLGGENESKPLFLYHVSKTDIRSVPCESSSPSRRDVVHAARQNNIPSLDSWDIARVEKDVNTVNIYNVTCTEDKELRSSERKEESLRLDDLILKCDQQIKDLSLRLESLNQELTVIREKEEEQERNIQKLIASEKLSLQKQLARVNEKLKERKFLASHAVVDAILRGKYLDIFYVSF
ncbi:hypothetical protein BDQ17DRAFT_353571 [Cyathus striatus]|nr:hypothetical protein BDQ17DRAFT_353571 [Cyathus striatus]